VQEHGRWLPFPEIDRANNNNNPLIEILKEEGAE
jgi:hypothetical protein